jgi:hypothetical protein
MTNNAVKESLQQTIDRFIVDADLAHDFVKGDKNTLVAGEDGPYPSAAMLVALIEARFNDLFDTLSRKIHLVTTQPLVITEGKIHLLSKPVGDIVHNEARVYVDLTEDDFNVDGSLKGNRPYVIEEHVNLIVSDNVVTFAGADASIEGCHAVVSYLSF